MKETTDIVRKESSILEVPYAVPSLLTLQRVGDSAMMEGMNKMVTILQSDEEGVEVGDKIKAFNAIVNASKYLTYRSNNSSPGNDELEDDLGTDE